LPIPNFSIATLLDMVSSETCVGGLNSVHTKHDEEGHVPCPCQDCIDGKSSDDDTSGNDDFDLMSNNDGLALQAINATQVNHLRTAV
jgi:hypothetical protein